MKPRKERTVPRGARVAERVREELAFVLGRSAKDPRLAGVVISRVTMTDDLRHTRVYIRTLDPERVKEALAGLESATPMLRSEVTKRAKLRYAPEITFFYDTGLDAQTRVEQLLAEIKTGR